MRRRKIFKALWKPQLYLGCERIPFVMAIMCSGIITMAGQTWPVKVAGVAFGVFLILVMRKINKNEPLAFLILIRYISHQKYYLSCAKYPSKPYKPQNLDL